MLHLLSICCYRYHCRFFIGIKLFNLVFANIFSRDVCAVCLVTQSCLTLCDTMDCSPPNSLVHGDSPGKNSEVGCHALLQGIFPTQGSNTGLLHCRQVLNVLSYHIIPQFQRKALLYMCKLYISKTGWNYVSLLLRNIWANGWGWFEKKRWTQYIYFTSLILSLQNVLLGKEYVKAVYCHLVYLTYTQSASWEMLDWMKHKLESRLLVKI